jgi:hypothetical protein
MNHLLLGIWNLIQLILSLASTFSSLPLIKRLLIGNVNVLEVIRQGFHILLLLVKPIILRILLLLNKHRRVLALS